MQIEKEVLKDLLFGLLTAVNAAEDGASWTGYCLEDILFFVAENHPEEPVRWWLQNELENMQEGD